MLPGLRAPRQRVRVLVALRLLEPPHGSLDEGDDRNVAHVFGRAEHGTRRELALAGGTLPRGCLHEPARSAARVSAHAGLRSSVQLGACLGDTVLRPACE